LASQPCKRARAPQRRHRYRCRVEATLCADLCCGAYMLHGGSQMSEELEGTVNKLGGRAQSAVGDALGDAKTSTEGRIREAAGKIQENYGAAAETVRGFTEELTERIHETPLLAVLAAAGVGYLLGRLTARD